MNNDDSNDDFWKGLERSAAYARSLPAWMKGGINLKPVNFTTFAEDGSGPLVRPFAVATETLVIPPAKSK